MDNQNCPKCGAPKTPGSECASCGVIYAKAQSDDYARRKMMDEARRKADAVVREMNGQQFGSNLIKCPTCGHAVSQNAPTCPSCGEIINATVALPNKSTSKSTITGYIGAMIMAVGVFCPLVSLPIVGSINYFNNGKGDGSFVLLTAAAAAAAVFWNKFKILPFAGGATLAILAYDFWNFYSKMAKSKAEMHKDMAGNPFGGLADAAFNAVQLQWGWIVMLTGAIMLISAFVLKGKADD